LEGDGGVFRFIFLKGNKMESKGKKQGFTIIELLTVMSIIIILIGIMMPSYAAIRRYSKAVKQKGQFHDISTGLEMFSIDFDGYPDSKGKITGTPPNMVNMDLDTPPAPYCGAMRLCEAMVGKDGFGFHPDSRFTARGTDSTGTIFYYPKPITANDNRRERKHTYIDSDKYKMAYLLDLSDVSTSVYSGDPCQTVICDVYGKTKGRETHARLSLPVLYYKADTTQLGNDSNDDPIKNGTNIYNIFDNHDISGLPVDGVTGLNPLHDVIPPSTTTPAQVFYRAIRDKKVTSVEKPYNDNTYILLSAGWDGLFGTKDDIYNFAE
jgi:type II secretory pathway pseudopilin PulG